MRDLTKLDRYRLRNLPRAGDGSCGAFMLPGGVRVLAASGMGWDHVSASLQDRCPTWGEMEAVKRAFFRDDETAMQLHVPAADHINVHPYCLHLWRPHGVAIPRPPSILVG